MEPSFLEQTGFGKLFADLVRCQQQSEVDNRVKQAHRCTVTIVELDQSFPINEAGDDVGGFVQLGVIQQNSFFLTHGHDGTNSQNQHDDDGTGNSRKGDVNGLFPSEIVRADV